MTLVAGIVLSISQPVVAAQIEYIKITDWVHLCPVQFKLTGSSQVYGVHYDRANFHSILVTVFMAFVEDEEVSLVTPADGSNECGIGGLVEEMIVLTVM